MAAFNRHGVRYVSIGAFAALQQGAILPPTHDIDFTPAAGRANLDRLSAALRDLGARIRTHAVSGGLEFDHNGESLARAGIWNLVCSYGEFDLSFRPSGWSGSISPGHGSRSRDGPGRPRPRGPSTPTPGRRTSGKAQHPGSGKAG